MLREISVEAGVVIEYIMLKSCLSWPGASRGNTCRVNAFEMPRVSLRDRDELGIAWATARSRRRIVYFVARLVPADSRTGHCGEGYRQKCL